MIVKLLTEHHLEFLSFKGGCRSSFESTLAKMSNCWKSHATAHMSLIFLRTDCTCTSFVTGIVKGVKPVQKLCDTVFSQFLLLYAVLAS